MVDVNYLLPTSPSPKERHVVVIVHHDGPASSDKGYFYDSAEKDHGGSGPFDWPLKEAVSRAQQFATQLGLSQVAVRTRGNQ